MTIGGCVQEIVELHRFFEGWLSGSLPATDEVFGRLEAALAPGFLLISPDGSVLARAEVIAWVRGGHGGRGPSFRIHIRNPEPRLEERGLVLATYEEWQESGGESGPSIHKFDDEPVPSGLGGRLSTVVFRERPDAPNGVEWLHVHETTLPPGE